MLNFTILKRVVCSLIIWQVTSVAYAHSLQFDGKDDYVAVAHNDRFDDLSLIVYVKFRLDQLSSAKGVKQFLVSKEAGSGYTWAMYIDNLDDKITFATNSGTGGQIKSDRAISSTQEIEVLASISERTSSMEMYVNGMPQQQRNKSPRLIVESQGDLTFGAQEPGSNHLDGTLYNVRIWSGDKSDVQIDQVFDNVNEEDELVGRWDFFDVVPKVGPDGKLVVDANRSTTVEDTHKNNDGVVHGATWNMDTVTYVIPDEDFNRYWPGPLIGTMNIGVERQTPVDPNDWSWTLMPQERLDQCERIYHISAQEVTSDIWGKVPKGDDKFGDGTLRNPYASLDKAKGKKARRRHGSCFIMHAGTYTDRYWFADIVNDNPGPNHMLWVTAAGDGETILRCDNTHNLEWKAHDENIMQADWSKAHHKDSPGIVVMDDNFPYCCHRKWQGIHELEYDGDYFYDSEPKTLYIHSSGKNPYTQRNAVIIRDDRHNGESLIYAGGLQYVGLHGLTMTGCGSYAVQTFRKFKQHARGWVISHNTFKYMGKGSTIGALGWLQTKNRLHGTTSINRGFGRAGIAFGSAGGWPSSIGLGGLGAHGNILTWIGGEGIGGAGRNKSKGIFADCTATDNIVMNAWSVAIYPDTVQNFKLADNIMYSFGFFPSEVVAKTRKIPYHGSWDSVRKRLLAQCILIGDETAETYEEAFKKRGPKGIGQSDDINSHDIDITNNVCVGYRRGFDFLHSGGKSLSGLQNVNVLNNVFILPNWDGMAINDGFIGFRNVKDEESGSHYDSHYYNNIIIAPHKAGMPVVIKIGDRSMLDIDYNYYFQRRIKGYAYKKALKTWDDYRAHSGQDRHSRIGTIDSNGIISPAILKRSDWDLRGDFRFTRNDLMLSSGSEAVNTGTLVTDKTFNRDFDDKLRPIGGGWDLGPFEQGEWIPNKLKEINLLNGMLR